ncbi:hypothetical protein CSOJ01_14999 [Colletotrichum sojae]|uniref:Uncharacterized protein n=1 Tax=Colletotrichum sojae TaxID=2175907 RepID=A0A8H6IP92_9PEZI|nr:hypothetical protein CSOJ01_14999 [Colletotrichum sojae]
MNRLPQKLIDKIMSSLPSYRQVRKSWSRLHEYEEPVPSKDWLLKWAAIAALGPQMQVAIEQDTFRDLNITSTEIETLGAMESRYGHRAHFIKSISYLIVFPPSIEVHGVGKDEEIRVNNLAVPEAMSQLLLFLCRFPGLATVDLDITSDSVNNYIDGNDTARQGRRRYFGTNLNGIITLHSYLRVSAIQDMPIAPCVWSWSIGQASDVDPYVAEKMKYPVTYQFDPETSLALSKRFPNANSAHVRFQEINFFNHYRQEQRRRLIQAVQSFELPSTTFNLSIHIQTPGTFKSVPAPFLGPRGESWGSTIHRALGNIENFTYHGPVEPSFFWPYGPLENPKPFRPFLACLSISFDMVSSSGQPFSHSMVQDTISRGVGVKKDPRGMLPPGHGTREESRKASR